jgi:hypothetical protein
MKIFIDEILLLLLMEIWDVVCFGNPRLVTQPLVWEF